MVGPIFGPQAQDSLGRLGASLRKLEARGLIGETSHKGDVNITSSVGASVGASDRWTNGWLNKDFEILPTGSSLVALLQKGGVPAPDGRTRRIPVDSSN